MTSRLKNTEAYVDDIAMWSDNWEDYLNKIRSFLEAVLEVALAINLGKSKFAKGCVKYLGHNVGSGYMPNQIKLKLKPSVMCLLLKRERN